MNVLKQSTDDALAELRGEHEPKYPPLGCYIALALAIVVAFVVVALALAGGM